MRGVREAGETETAPLLMAVVGCESEDGRWMFRAQKRTIYRIISELVPEMLCVRQRNRVAGLGAVR